MLLLTHMRDEYISSEFIAKSININPVLVRKEISKLNKAGLLESKEGSAGGSRLAIDPEKLTLDKIYNAVKTEDDHLFGLVKKQPHAGCPIGSRINCQLEQLYQDIDGVVLDKLRSITLAEFHKPFV